MIRDYITFLWRLYLLSFTGSIRFYIWMFFLTLLTFLGVYAYAGQFAQGLTVTGMTNQVSWGLYIANFTFIVGLAAAAVMLVIPAYVYHNKDLHDVVILGELLAIASIVMCLLFVNVDLGRPDRFWHLLPPFGKFNFPISMLSWDVVVLLGYLVLNVHICGYLLYVNYRGENPKPLFYIPFVFIAIFWAISIHTVTAFLYVGLSGRPFWNAAIVAPRFIGSAFTAGPGFMFITFQIIRNYTNYKISDDALRLLRQIVTISLLINLFLVGCEAFKEFYAESTHASSARYLFFGLHGHDMLVPWIWFAIFIETIAAIIFITPPLARKWVFSNIACVFAIVGIWIEKGPGMVVSGFGPTPLGEIVEYFPTLAEAMICIGVWAFGILIYSWLVHLAIPILSGKVRLIKQGREQDKASL
ncbi:MAG: NrfD/PsrC family molybdoenzyme membrane anchor subunit [Thermodesulfobacteriota bacterium]|nr:NrfD/PsrC family molybdoenzyme membrane anchor subunit [Thermodesulfobacteriota bacterium]